MSTEQLEQQWLDRTTRLEALHTLNDDKISLTAVMWVRAAS